MEKLSKYFYRHEFKCKCGHCRCDTVDVYLLKLLDQIRFHFNSPITVNSAHRCEDYNEQVGGKRTSQHLVGKAADIVVRGVSAHKVYKWVDDQWPDTYGLGKYGSFTHVDVRVRRARW